jgi:hypothetical protein
VEEGGESFPVLIALKGPRSAQKGTASHHNSDDDSSTVSLNSFSSANRNKAGKSMAAPPGAGAAAAAGRHSDDEHSENASKKDSNEDDQEGEQEFAQPVEQVDALLDTRPSSPIMMNEHHYRFTPSEESRFHRPNLAKGHIKGGFLSDMHPEFGHHGGGGGHKHPTGIDAAYTILRAPAVVQNSHSASASALHSEGLINKLTRRGSTAQLEKSAVLTAQALAAMALNKPQPPPPQVQQLAKIVSAVDVKAELRSPPAPLQPVRSASTLKDPKEKDREKAPEKPKSKLMCSCSMKRALVSGV